MTLDEAINHAEEVAILNENTCKAKPDSNLKKYKKCAEEHRQLAEWLRDYKRLLEQQPCEDMVSREYLLDDDKYHTVFNDDTGVFEDVVYREDIKNAPSVTPTFNWIPVSERLPDDEQMVLVCSNTGNIEVSCGSRSTEIKDKFIWYTSGWKFGEVIAWRPLPEPYQEE